MGATVYPFRTPSKGSRVEGWAQWHSKLLETGDVGVLPEAAFTGVTGVASWLRSLFLGFQVKLTAGGHGLVSQVSLPSWPSNSPYLPLDFHVWGGSNLTSWGLRAVFVAVGVRGFSGSQVGAVSSAENPPFAGWSAERASSVFSPRFPVDATVGKNSSLSSEQGPWLLVISNPSEDVFVDIRGNIWSVLARCFRSHVGYWLSAWLGAAISFHHFSIEDWGVPACCMFPLWVLASTTFAWTWPQLGRQEDASGLILAAPPLPLMVVLHVLGGLFANASRKIVLAMACVMLKCRRGDLSARLQPTSFLQAIAEFLVLAAIAAIQPILGIAATGFRHFYRLSHVVGYRRQGLARALADDGEDAHGESWQIGLATLLTVQLVSFGQAVVLFFWLLAGQQHEASSPWAEKQLRADWPSSADVPSIWPNLPDGIGEPLALLPAIFAVVSQSMLSGTSDHFGGNGSNVSRKQRHPSRYSVVLAQCMRRCFFPVGAAMVGCLGGRTDWFWHSCSAALFLHGLAAVAQLIALCARKIPSKEE